MLERVEGPVHHAPEHPVQVRGLHGGVGQEQRDQRGHVGFDHAHPFGDADHPCLAHRGLRHLGHGVSGHDRPGRRHGVCSLERRRQRGQVGPDPVHRVATSDDPRRGDQHLGRPGAECAGYSGGQLRGIVPARHAVGHVGVLRHHGEGPQPAAGDMLTADGDARAGEPGAGEHRRRRTGRLGRDHHEVVGVVLDPDVGHVAPETAREGDDIGTHGQSLPAGDRRGRASPASAVARPAGGRGRRRRRCSGTHSARRRCGRGTVRRTAVVGRR